MIDTTDLAAYLSSKGVQVFRAAGQEVTAHCFACPDGDPKGKGKLYLNVESWLYQCKRCDLEGNRKTLLEHFGDEDAVKHVAGSDPGVRRRILMEAVDCAHEMLLGNKRAMEYLLGRGIDPELIIEQKIGYVPKSIGLSDMLPGRETYTFVDLITAGIIHAAGGTEVFNDHVVLPYWSHGSVVQLRQKQIGGLLKSTPGSHARVFNSDSLHGAEEVLIVEGEWDTYSLVSVLRNSGDRRMESMAVVGLPGAGSWPEGFVESLEGCRRVFIGLDPDETGKKFAAKLKDEIGLRARVVELPEALPKCDWNDFLNERSDKNPHGGHTWVDVRELLIEADLAGKRLFTAPDAAAKWRRQKAEAPGLKFGWPTLDAILRPGLKPGQLMIPIARTGQGKSVWLSNVVHNLRRVPTLYVSMELTAAEIWEHLHRIHRFWFPKATHEETLQDYRWLRIVDQNRMSKGDLGDLIREFAEDVGERPRLVLVDYLQYYARGFRGGSQRERVEDAVMELKAVAKEEAVGMIAPTQANRGAEQGKPIGLSDARESGEIENTADHLISIFRPDQAIDKAADAEQQTQVQTGTLSMQLLKSRHGGTGRLFNFRFSVMSLVIVDVVDRVNATRVEQENSLARQGVHYDDLRARQDESVAQGVLL